MRIAFSIVLNGLHHLQHQNFYQTMLQNFDFWVIVEGQALPNGSTSWCKPLSLEYQSNGRSIDGTHEFLTELDSQYPNLKYIASQGPWESKDQMVNIALDQIRNITNKCFLWEVDVDEQWTLGQLKTAEQELINRKCKIGCFLSDYYVTEKWVSKGKWGEGIGDPYKRLWNWEGESFIYHEPPTLNTSDKSITLLSPRFKHYAYYFKKDAQFKSDYYGGHENILHAFNYLQESPNTTEPLTVLFPDSMQDYYNNTILIRI